MNGSEKTRLQTFARLPLSMYLSFVLSKQTYLHHFYVLNSAPFYFLFFQISQVLGHNEHLYVKFPKGIWNWQAFLSAMLFVQAVLILFFPRQACQLKLLGIQQPHEKDGLMMASKYYAVSLFGT